MLSGGPGLGRKYFMAILIELSAAATDYFHRHWREDDESLYQWSKCWIWRGRLNGDGYGVLKIEGRNVLAHRYSVVLSGRRIPMYDVVDHLCETIECVNPDHLEVVTGEENTRRVGTRKRQRFECHDYAPNNIADNQAMYEARKECEAKGGEFADCYISAVWAQVAYWGSWGALPKRAKTKLIYWKEEMANLLMSLSDQIITDIEDERNYHLRMGDKLSRLGMIRVLIKEALIMRKAAVEEDRSLMRKLVGNYDVQLRARGARIDDDPAAPPEMRKPRKLPDGTTL